MGKQPGIQKQQILWAFFIIALGFLFYGAWSNVATMRLTAVGIIFLTVAAVYLTWVAPFYLSKSTVLMTMAISTAYAFLLLVALIGIIFLIDAFFLPLTSVTFAVFGSIFVSTILARAYLAAELEAI